LIDEDCNANVLGQALYFAPGDDSSYEYTGDWYDDNEAFAIAFDYDYEEWYTMSWDEYYNMWDDEGDWYYYEDESEDMWDDDWDYDYEDWEDEEWGDYDEDWEDWDEDDFDQLEEDA